MDEETNAIVETGETTSAAETPEQTVPLNVVQSMREEQQRLKDQLKIMTDQYDVMRMALSSKKEESQPKAPQKDPQDLVTWGEAEHYLSEQQAALRLEMQEVKMLQANPDYTEVVTKFLPQAIKEDPELAAEIEIMMKTNKNAAAYAYKRAKQSKAFQEQEHKVKHNEQAKKIVENSERVGNLSQISPGASVNTQKGNYWSLSNEEFRNMMNSNIGLG